MLIHKLPIQFVARRSRISSGYLGGHLLENFCIAESARPLLPGVLESFAPQMSSPGFARQTVSVGSKCFSIQITTPGLGAAWYSGGPVGSWMQIYLGLTYAADDMRAYHISPIGERISADSLYKFKPSSKCIPKTDRSPITSFR